MVQDPYNSIVLCILDGFGVSTNKDNPHDAIAQANTPFLDFLNSRFPHTELTTSGESVGLPEGQMGNSEVGHMTIGSGRIIQQDLLRISNSIADGSLFLNENIQKLILEHRNKNTSVHILGLCSDGGVHSHIEHIIYCATILSQNNVNVKLHLFLDGRDVAPNSAKIYLERINDLASIHDKIKISTLSGRFYAMDRDNRWDRVELAYNAIVYGKNVKIDGFISYIDNNYNQNIFDEFIPPVSAANYNGIEENDSILFANFRSDRIRQLATSLLDINFDRFTTKNLNLKFKIGLTHYSAILDRYLETIFPEHNIKNNLAEIISLNSMNQLKIAETEKYAHVTFFFNNGREDKYINEDRILIPSPKVSTYDLKPEMSAYELTTELVNAINSKKYHLIVVNYANCDMVGHSGKLDSAISAVETIDTCLKKVYDSILSDNTLLMITADHGNVEHMFDTTENIAHTAHTTNPVPLYLVAENLLDKKLALRKGNLSDIAPTILDLMNLEIPNEITGKSIIKR